MRFFVLLGAGIAVLAALGCGQKGPLYLRENPPPGVKPEKTDTYRPMPYPKATQKEAPQGEDRGAAQQ